MYTTIIGNTNCEDVKMTNDKTCKIIIIMRFFTITHIYLHIYRENAVIKL